LRMKCGRRAAIQ